MSNANDAKLVRIATHPWGGNISSATPLTGDGNRFQVVVEGRAGSVLAASGQPYSLEIVAFDLSAGANPHSAANAFTQRRAEQFDAAYGWPSKTAIFTVTLNDVAAVQGHLLRYYAILTSANQITSFVESPLFLLFCAPAQVRRTFGWVQQAGP